MGEVIHTQALVRVGEKAVEAVEEAEQIADRENLVRLSRFLAADVALATEAILIEWSPQRVLVATVNATNPWVRQRLAQALHTKPERIHLKPLRKERFATLYNALYATPTSARAQFVGQQQQNSPQTELDWKRIDAQYKEEQHKEKHAKEERERVEAARERGLGLTIREIITEAVVRAASDVHFEPTADGGQILIRRHGQLAPLVSNIPQERYLALTNALAERAGASASDIGLRPVDAVINFVFHNRHTDEYRRMTIRFASVPDIRGPAITLRIQGERALGFEEIGFEAEQLAAIERACRYRQGVLLVTGPTGSGKSVTLEAIKRELARRNPSLKFCETGDPIEFPSPRRVQVEVRSREEAKKVFRTFLRMDPDIICQGEVRDAEMAALLFEAANTGHLVLSTLHTNDAASTFNRLLDFALPRYEIADVLRLVVAQRLVPRLCHECAQPLDDDETEKWIALVAHEVWPEQSHQAALALATAARRGLIRRNAGCSRCQTGGAGRIAVTETLLVDATMSEGFKNGQNATQLVAAAIARGAFSPFSRIAVGKTLAGQIPADAIYDLVLLSSPVLAAAENLQNREAAEAAREFVDRAAQGAPHVKTHGDATQGTGETAPEQWIDAEWELVEPEQTTQATGFSLLELIIVIAIIAAIAAFALPKLWQTQQAANEQIVRARLSEIAAQQAVFRNLLGRGRYATLNELQNTQAEGRPLVAPADVALSGWSFFDAETPTSNTFCLGARRSADALALAITEDGRVRRCQPPQYTTASRLCPPAN